MLLGNKSNRKSEAAKGSLSRAGRMAPPRRQASTGRLREQRKREVVFLEATHLQFLLLISNNGHLVKVTDSPRSNGFLRSEQCGHTFAGTEQTDHRGNDLKRHTNKSHTHIVITQLRHNGEDDVEVSRSRTYLFVFLMRKVCLKADVAALRLRSDVNSHVMSILDESIHGVSTRREEKIIDLRPRIDHVDSRLASRLNRRR